MTTKRNDFTKKKINTIRFFQKGDTLRAVETT